MKTITAMSVFGISASVMLSYTACNYTPEGECYPREQFTEGGGEGAGPIVPTGAGTGDFGSEPPREPQSEPPDPDTPVCNRISGGPCDDKCQAGYDDASIECAKIEDASQRRACQDKAHEIYWACKQNCEQSVNKTCMDKWYDCVNDSPSFCRKKWNKKIFCTTCLERCNAGDYPSPKCQQCRF